MLSPSHTHELFVLDYAKGELLWKRGTLKGKSAGELCEGKWIIKLPTSKGEIRRYKRDKLIYLYEYGYLPKSIEHKDGNLLNDKPGNLKGNGCRAGYVIPTKRIRELPRGVTKRGKKFSAAIMLAGRNKYLGIFDTPEEAHEFWSQALANHRAGKPIITHKSKRGRKPKDPLDASSSNLVQMLQQLASATGDGMLVS